jgi:hypothetical protein
MVGTSKGGFLLVLKGGAGGRLLGPFLPGWDLYHLNWDPRTETLLAAAAHPVHGALVARSGDWGSSWQQDTTGLEHGEGEGKVDRVWHIRPGADSQPGLIWAGVAEAGLFRSYDGGRTFRPVASLRQHPSRAAWTAGGGGLCLHSIVPDPRDPARLYVAISAAGVFRTDDGGFRWRPLNRGVRADFLPDRFPEVGQCVHKLGIDAENPDVLYQQNHCGVYRSDDRGESWTEITAGLPSSFGMPLGVHPRRGGLVFTVPLEADVKRVPPGGALAVWRSRDAGRSWQRCARGLPGRNVYVTVMREAMAVDGGDPCCVVFGTQSGHLFGSVDDGDSWKVLAKYLPPVRSVELGLRPRSG